VSATSSAFFRRGTRGSPSSRPQRTTQSGMKPASTRALSRLPAMTSEDRRGVKEEDSADSEERPRQEVHSRKVCRLRGTPDGAFRSAVRGQCWML
jgi:hypothetical protein